MFNWCLPTTELEEKGLCSVLFGTGIFDGQMSHSSLRSLNKRIFASKEAFSCVTGPTSRQDQTSTI